MVDWVKKQVSMLARFERRKRRSPRTPKIPLSRRKNKIAWLEDPTHAFVVCMYALRRRWMMVERYGRGLWWSERNGMQREGSKEVIGIILAKATGLLGSRPFIRSLACSCSHRSLARIDSWKKKSPSTPFPNDGSGSNSNSTPQVPILSPKG